MVCVVFFSTNVTAESGLTKSAEFIRLDDGAEVWAEIILQKDNKRNPKAAEEMRQAGFDIKERAKQLLVWYFEHDGN